MSMPLRANTTVVRSAPIPVTAIAGGAGDVVVNSTASIDARLRNTGVDPVEYKVDAGPWLLLRDQSSALLDINLSQSVVRTRRGFGALPGTVELEITSFAAGHRAGDKEVNLGLKLPLVLQAGISYTLALTDAGKQVDMSNAAANTATIPLNATVPFEIGAVVMVCQIGAGITTIAAAGGVTMLKPPTRNFAINEPYEKAECHKVGVDTWRVLA